MLDKGTRKTEHALVFAHQPPEQQCPNRSAQKVCEASISRERSRLGYCIFTACGPRVTVDYYADSAGIWHWEQTRRWFFTVRHPFCASVSPGRRRGPLRAPGIRIGALDIFTQSETSGTKVR